MATAAASDANYDEDNMCNFCGDFPIAYACSAPSCSRKKLCENCDQIWHGHPDRNSHRRSRVGALSRQRPAGATSSTGITWTCPHCTFENAIEQMWSPGDRLLCGVCSRTTIGSELNAASARSEQQQKNGHATDAVATPEGVHCPLCTFLNSRKAKKCQMCGAEMPKKNRTPDTAGQDLEREEEERKRWKREEEERSRRERETEQQRRREQEEERRIRAEKAEERRRKEMEERIKNEREDEERRKKERNDEEQRKKEREEERRRNEKEEEDRQKREREVEERLKKEREEKERRALEESDRQYAEALQREEELEAGNGNEEMARREEHKRAIGERVETRRNRHDVGMTASSTVDNSVQQNRTRRQGKSAPASEATVLLQDDYASVRRERNAREKEERMKRDKENAEREEAELRKWEREEAERLRLEREAVAEKERRRLEQQKRERDEAERLRLEREAAAEKDRRRLEQQKWERMEAERLQLDREAAAEKERRRLEQQKWERMEAERLRLEREAAAEKERRRLERQMWEREEAERLQLEKRAELVKERLRQDRETGARMQRRALISDPDEWQRHKAESALAATRAKEVPNQFTSRHVYSERHHGKQQYTSEFNIEEMLLNGVHGAYSLEQDTSRNRNNLQEDVISMTHPRSTVRSHEPVHPSSDRMRQHERDRGQDTYARYQQDLPDDTREDYWSSDESVEAADIATPRVVGRAASRKKKSGSGTTSVSEWKYTCAHCGKSKTRGRLPSTRYKCFYCNNASCFKCGREWENLHTGRTCKEYEQMAGKAVNPMAPQARSASAASRRTSTEKPLTCNRCHCTVAHVPRDSSSVLCRNCGNVLLQY